MSDNKSPLPEDPRTWKIFPRNLTARAAYIVPGNPTSSRPEAAVDNCYPGLEMDARNIQKFFIPGLYFEVYRSDGARLAELSPAKLAKVWERQGLTQEDLSHDLMLWVMKGRTAATQPIDDPPTTTLSGKDQHGLRLDGLYAWRKARDLFPGRVAIGFGPGYGKPKSAAYGAANAALEKLWAERGPGPTLEIERDKSGTLLWAVLVAERSTYLNQEGVLEPEVYAPGELTRTLCTPWTYDFRDCQCFYWASNKPDIVASEDGQYEHLNFQRHSRDIEPQTEDIAYGYEARRDQEIDYAEMMVDWEQLRPVLNGREFGQSYVPPPGPAGDQIFTVEELREQLHYVATVEHGLAVQYLYAYYSIDAPYAKPASSSVEDSRRWSAAQEIFEIAIDEMRHFRWANEVLKLIGGETTVHRSAELGRRLNVPFYLQSLTSQQLQWFINVERPSRSVQEGLDGMYVKILRSLQEDSCPVGIDPESRMRAIDIVKLIIDEGEAHYVRFSTAQQNLAFYDRSRRSNLPDYVRRGRWRVESDVPKRVPLTSFYGAPVAEDKSSNSDGFTLQERSDHLYQALLYLLSAAFGIRGEAQSGKALSHAIGLMFRMNKVNLALAAQGWTPLFQLPEGWEDMPPVTSKELAKERLDLARGLLRDEPEVLPADGSGPDHAAAAHNHPLSVMFDSLGEAIDHAEYG